MSSTIPLPPHEQLCNRYCRNKHTHSQSADSPQQPDRVFASHPRKWHWRGGRLPEIYLSFECGLICYHQGIDPKRNSKTHLTDQTVVRPKQREIYIWIISRIKVSLLQLVPADSGAACPEPLCPLLYLPQSTYQCCFAQNLDCTGTTRLALRDANGHTPRTGGGFRAEPWKLWHGPQCDGRPWSNSYRLGNEVHFAVWVCVWVCVGGRMHAMHAITGRTWEIVRSRLRCTPLPPCRDDPGRGAVRCLICG